MASKEKITEFISILSENFKGSPSEMLTRIIAENLKVFNEDQVTQGLNKLLCSRVYSGFPALAEILEAVEGGDDALQLEAYQAFEQILSIPCDVYGRPDLAGLKALDPAARQALRMMGETPSEWSSANLAFKRKEFLEIYMGLAKNPQKLSELGYHGSPPRLEGPRLNLGSQG